MVGVNCLALVQQTGRCPLYSQVFLQRRKGAGTQRGGSRALSVGCFASESGNRFRDAHPPLTVAVSEQVLLCELLARLEPRGLVEAEETDLLGLTLRSLQPDTTTAFVAVTPDSHFYLREKHSYVSSSLDSLFTLSVNDGDQLSDQEELWFVFRWCCPWWVSPVLLPDGPEP